MPDDLDHNKRLINLVEKHRVLYDHSCDGNSNRVVQEQAWREVADELGENMTACKEKWKNIRSCYTRHLRLKATDKIKKPYYLSKHLEFLYPFCKTLLPHSNFNSTPLKSKGESSKSNVIFVHRLETMADYDDKELQEDSHDTCKNNENEIESSCIYLQDSKESFLGNMNGNQTEAMEPNKEENIDSSNSKEYKSQKSKIVYSTEEQAREKSCLYNLNDDPDLIFFKSLLPDLHRMNNKQKIRLKLAVLREIHNILYPNDCDFDPLLATS